MCTECNGWTNYQTWVVNLWLTNDSDTMEHCHSLVSEGETWEGADRLKDYVEELDPDLDASMFSDLLGYALTGVNWQEIARNMRESIAPLYSLHITCVEASGDDIETMIDSAEDVTYDELSLYCNLDHWQKVYGQMEGMSLEHDKCVSFHKSTYQDKPCYFVVWSAIEHVYLEEG